MSHRITLIPGDGIGPEVTEAAVRCIEATGVDVEWDKQIAGTTALEKGKEVLPKETLDSIRKNKVGLKGPITTPVGEGFRSVNVAMRKELKLYANIRPAKSIPGTDSKYEDIDIVVIRENLEDLYSGIEYKKGEFTERDVPKDAAVSLKVISEKNSRNIINFAHNYAKENNRKRVTAVHKANILKFTDGMFLDLSKNIGKDYPDMKNDDRIVDNMAMQLVTRPEKYDVLVCPNLYGDILSDLCAGLVGGLGVAPSGNIGNDYALFEPVHGSAPKYAGKNKVNPTAEILAGAMMLRHIGEKEAADRLENAVRKVIEEGKNVTYDLGGSAGTKEMTDAIIDII